MARYMYWWERGEGRRRECVSVWCSVSVCKAATGFVVQLECARGAVSVWLIGGGRLLVVVDWWRLTGGGRLVVVDLWW